ncbi:ExbD/TolR family protein [Bdellovibrio sp. HCB337]|uniref:ExbD/TolR family protein n=1 Tax=Bdellovibrio sp. HCB337 TaxID=3394358 RepID=UPI0039A78758
MRRVKKVKINHEYEFELDLAPLLAVMVKLVPVLLVSSAFVQMTVIETQLPQVVQQAIEKQDKDEKAAHITIEVKEKEGVKIIVKKDGKESVEVVPKKADGNFDFARLHERLRDVKTQNPEVFKVDISPDAGVSYKDIVHVMDEARRSRDNKIRFPVFDKVKNQEVQTDYMFPEVNFANTMEG